MRSNAGGGLMGWALLCGVPGTLAALVVAWPLGVVVGALTLAAFLLGRHMEQDEG